MTAQSMGAIEMLDGAIVAWRCVICDGGVGAEPSRRQGHNHQRVWDEKPCVHVIPAERPADRNAGGPEAHGSDGVHAASVIRLTLSRPTVTAGWRMRRERNAKCVRRAAVDRPERNARCRREGSVIKMQRT